MLEPLFGTKNVQNILLFLFVNGTCYGSQLQRALKTALTPIQKGLSRLEKGGIIMSESEGKTRLYRFHPSYPLLPELEILLKRAYQLLSSQEKKLYYYFKVNTHLKPLEPASKLHVLQELWERLKKDQTPHIPIHF